MKAITIYQPWASLIAIGAKEYETRSWSTNYRGPIAIHAGKKDQIGAMNRLPENTRNKIRQIWRERCGNRLAAIMPEGRIVAVAELIDVIKTEDHEPSETEKMLGDWNHGRYAWKLANVTMLTNPVLINGKRGFWNWEVPPHEIQ